MADIAVRRGEQKDWPLLWPLLQQMGFTYDEENSRCGVLRVLQLPDHCLLVADNNDNLLGYAWAQNYGPHIRSGRMTARLDDLFVLPDQRRKGVGAALFAAVVDWARNQDVTWLQWQASPAALPFYERIGLKGDPCPDSEHPSFEIQFQPFP